MKHPILILLTVLVPSTAFAKPPELCEQSVYVDETGDPLTDSAGVHLSRSCELAGPDVPVWNGTVCCSIDEYGAQCVTAEHSKSCDAGLDPYYCEYGEEIGDEFICYQSLPSACMSTNCDGPPAGGTYTPGPQEDAICCIGPICYEWDDLDYEDCEGFYTWCSDGYSKVDGTVECFD